MIAADFWRAFSHYLMEIAPALFVGFLLSGLFYELVPSDWISKHLGYRNMKGILYATLVGVLVPVCCWGCLPIAVSFRKKGASLGTIMAMLVATPATSISAIIVTERFFGLKFAVYLFFSVIVMGIVSGLIGNRLTAETADADAGKENDCCLTGGSHEKNGTEVCCGSQNTLIDEGRITSKKSFWGRSVAVLKFAFVDMPRDIGKETLLGLALAALVSSIIPLGMFVHQYMAGALGYLFANVIGVLMYMCATMGVPLVDALVKQGMSIGAGFVLLLVGPITSYGTLLVLRKEFGIKVVGVYLGTICILATLFGCIYSFFIS